MSIALEEEYTRCSLNVETLSIFAKASYLKKYLEEDKKYGTAQEALTDGPVRNILKFPAGRQ